MSEAIGESAPQHEFKPSYSGMVCEQMVMRDGGGDACGLPASAHRRVGQEQVVTEYAVEWLAPEDIAGTITVAGVGIYGLDQAERYVNVYFGLPGGQKGQILSRTITWSEWKVAVNASS